MTNSPGRYTQTPKPDNARQVALRKVAVLVDTLLADSDTERPEGDRLTCGALREAVTLLGGLLPVTPRRIGMLPELGMGYGAGNEGAVATGSNGQSTHLVGGGGGQNTHGLVGGGGGQGSMPSPYSAASLSIVGAFELSPAQDTARAFDELEAWIAGSPGSRACWTIDRMQGKWRVGLSCGDERYSASQDAELRGAIRNALMIAKFAGCL